MYCYTRARLIVSYRSKTYYTPLSRKKGISASTVANIAASYTHNDASCCKQDGNEPCAASPISTARLLYQRSRIGTSNISNCFANVAFSRTCVIS